MKRVAIAAVGLDLALALAVGAGAFALFIWPGQTTTPAPAPTPSNTPTPFEQIEAHCREIGTSFDWETLPTGIRLREGYVYRCYDGRPLVCEGGATMGSCMRARLDEPTGIRHWCRDHPNDFPPGAVTGHATVFNWRCVSGQVVFDLAGWVDPAGFDEVGFSNLSWSAMTAWHIEPASP
jgi:hypothetical protein